MMKYLEHLRYVLRAFAILPVTFIKRVVFGADPYWKRYFWSKWGFVSPELRKAASAGKVIWIDALGGGEATQLVSFTRLLKERFPGCRLVLSTNNPDSFKFSRRLPFVDCVFDIPWDIAFVLRRLIRTIKPELLIVVDQVRFPMVLREAKKQGVPTVLVSAALANNYQTSEYMKRAMLFEFYRFFDRIGVINEEARRGYLNIGAPAQRVTVTGDMKFDLDACGSIEGLRGKLSQELKVRPGDFIFVCGSVHAGEDKVLINAYSQTKKELPELRLIMVPRYLKDLKKFTDSLEGSGLDYIKKSDIKNDASLEQKVVLVDTFGELNALYSLATAIFIGNSLIPRDKFALGQNIVEPLLHCRPVFFGPHMNKWLHITSRIKEVWPGFEVRTCEDIREGLVYIRNNKDTVDRFRERCRSIIEENSSAVRNNLSLVYEIMDKGR